MRYQETVPSGVPIGFLCYGAYSQKITAFTMEEADWIDRDRSSAIHISNGSNFRTIRCAVADFCASGLDLEYRPLTIHNSPKKKETEMENEQNPIAVQHAALKNLLENIYRSDLKAFLGDLAEIAETDSEVIEGLWECAQMIPNDPSRPK